MKILALALLALSFIAAGAAYASAVNAPSETPEFYLLQGKWQLAIEGYKDIAEPTVHDLLMLADAYFYSGNYDLARLTWKTALKKEDNADSKISLAMLDAIKKKRHIKKLEAMLRDLSDNARLWRATGIAHMKNGLDDRAIYYFQVAAEKNPGDYMSYFYIGNIYENHFLFGEAAEAYKKSIGINPNYAQALNNLGYSHKERHFWTYAIEMYRRAVEIMPENASFLYNLGNAYNHKEMRQEAFECYQKAVQLEPEFAKAHYNLGKAYIRKGIYRQGLEELKLYVKFWNSSISPADAPPPEEVENEIHDLEELLIFQEDMGKRRPGK
ncbi:MAG: tetratricopeptide repeat protein [Thermodesulfovibrionales bacterium]|nr:tetratricopeptide repeat protein [Thermodesulfovibrionales bacterium]